MTDEEMQEKIHTIYNRCLIAIFIFEHDHPQSVHNALPTLYEDIAATIQDILFAEGSNIQPN